MLGRIITNLVIWLMRGTRFSIENRTKCTIALLDKLNFVPYVDIIKSDNQGKIVINNKQLDLEKAKQVREGAKAMLDNQIRNLVREQVAFRAVNVGVHKGETPEQLYFSKVALWIYQQEDELYHSLAQE